MSPASSAALADAVCDRAQGQKAAGARFDSKAAADILFHFGHAQVGFGLIVGKRNPRIFEKAQAVMGNCTASVKVIG